jgi:hypothetical protein
LHRRRRALQRVAQLADGGRVGAALAEHVLIPLCMHIVYESTSAAVAASSDAALSSSSSSSSSSASASASSSIGGGTASKTATSVAASEGALADEAVRCVGALASRLGWTAYYRLVASVLKPIRSHPQHLRVLVRVLCSIVDRFHFDVAAPSTANVNATALSVAIGSGGVKATSGDAKSSTSLSYSSSRPPAAVVTDAYDPANSTVQRQVAIRERVHARRLVRLDLRLILRLEVAVLTLENHYLFAPAAIVILDAVLIVGNECRR